MKFYLMSFVLFLCLALVLFTGCVTGADEGSKDVDSSAGAVAGSDDASSEEDDDEGDGLTREQVQAVVGPNLEDVTACYEDITTQFPEAQGKVIVSFIISKAGSPSSVEFTEDTVKVPLLQKCLEDRIKSWKFPASKGNTTVSYPFKFHLEEN